MKERAKLFVSGGSQAVRLPKAYRFENQGEVRISREGDRVILEPARRRWSRAGQSHRRLSCSSSPGHAAGQLVEAEVRTSVASR